MLPTFGAFKKKIEESVEATKTPEIYHGKGFGLNPHQLFGLDRNVEPPNDYERAACLERQTQPLFENDILYLRRKQSNTWKALPLEMGDGELNFSSQFPYLAGNALSDHLNGLRGDRSS